MSRKHLNKVADALIAAGYEVTLPGKENDFLDVWGFLRTKRHARRKRCFEEIYCVCLGENYSYWSTDLTSDSGDEDIYIFEDMHGELDGLSELLGSIGVEPIKKRKVA